ncbi:MAG TPA: hypothetical protein VEB59_09380 [Gemmatimonadales bacterium]|nr:hypothetical protein [Gemmatimonadales bacterium]
MTAWTVVEIVLALGALFLLLRDMRRAWLDGLRRPVTLLVPALIAALLIGSLSGREHPSPWWLMLPAAVLAWEVARGWRAAPRCHLWEAGAGTFGVGLVLAAAGLGLVGGTVRTALLAMAASAAAVGAVLLWRSRKREPHPGCRHAGHYERRSAERGR